MLVMVGKRKSTKMAFLDIVMSKNSRMAFLASGEFCRARDFALYLKCCLEILGGRALEGTSVMALGSPCPLTLLYALTVLCSQDQLGLF